MNAGIRGKRVLVVEDEYLLADDLREALEREGAEVLGPVPDTDGAYALIGTGERVDVAVLDINLNGASVFPLADALVERGTPLAFATGYDRQAIPERFAAIARLEKPVRPGDIIATLASLAG
jgi:CheY-like chemotaxis protein